MKDFILLANVNAVTYKDFFPLLKEGKARGGYTFNKTMLFETPEGELKSGPNIAWFTSLPTPGKKKLVLTKKYHKEDYPHYDNYNAIEVGRIKDIPYNYDCVMGVPITIFGFDLDNIEIMSLPQPRPKTGGVGQNTQECSLEEEIHSHKRKVIIMGMAAGAKEITGLQPKTETAGPILDGEALYARAFIRLKNY